jgi:hypothetical protein
MRAQAIAAALNYRHSLFRADCVQMLHNLLL